LAVVAFALPSVAVAEASAYLHVANAQNYARAHVYATFCDSSSYWCPTYPWATGWYDRITDSYVRVEIEVRRRNSGDCYRTFAVHGSDANPYITTDGSSYGYYCF
jgi:hypothetical protein